MQADIGFGFLIAVITAHVFGVPITTTLVIICSIAALLPDIDFLVEFFRHGSVGGTVIREHRELLHFPITFIPFIALVWVLFGSVWGFVFLMGTLTHFLHDTVGIGWGIKWFWPISTRAYKLFSDERGRPAWTATSWSAEEMPRLAKEHGVEHWIRDIYLKPFSGNTEGWLSLVNIIEWLIFLVGLGVLLLYTGTM